MHEQEGLRAHAQVEGICNVDTGAAMATSNTCMPVLATRSRGCTIVPLAFAPNGGHLKGKRRPQWDDEEAWEEGLAMGPPSARCNAAQPRVVRRWHTRETLPGIR